MVGSSAPVAFFETTPRSLEWLLSRVDGLRHWRRTPYEDLAFYRSDGAVWLASSSHEAFASLCLTEEEAGALRRELPWLHLKPL